MKGSSRLIPSWCQHWRIPSAITRTSNGRSMPDTSEISWWTNHSGEGGQCISSPWPRRTDRSVRIGKKKIQRPVPLLIVPGKRILLIKYDRRTYFLVDQASVEAEKQCFIWISKKASDVKYNIFNAAKLKPFLSTTIFYNVCFPFQIWEPLLSRTRETRPVLQGHRP